MKNTNIIIGVLVVSLLLNVYQFATWQSGQQYVSSYSNKNNSEMMHRMPDGSMMMNSATPNTMGGMMMDMTASLKGKTGKDLEKTFLEEMIVHHQGAVDMAKELLKGTTNSDLIKFANDIITVQSKEIEMQKDWLKNY